MALSGDVDNRETVRGVRRAEPAVRVWVQKPSIDPEPHETLTEEK